MRTNKVQTNFRDIISNLSVKQKTVISVIVLIVCPLIAAAVVMTHQTSALLLEYYKNQNYAETISSINLFDSQIESLMSVRTVLSRNKRIKEHYSTDNLRSVFELREDLKYLSSVQPNIQELYLFIPDDPFFFSNKSSYSRSTFCEKYAMTEEEFQSITDSVYYPGTLRYAINHYTMAESILFFLPFPEKASKQIVIVDVYFRSIKNVLVADTGNTDEYFVVIDVNNHYDLLIQNTIDRSSLEMDEILHSLNSFPTEFIQQEFSIENKNYFFTSVFVSSFPLRLFKIVPSQLFVSKIIEQKNQWLITILIIALLVLLAFLFSSQRLFRPMTKLIGYIFSKGWTNEKKASETEYLQSYMVHINEQNEMLNSEINYLHSSQKRDLLIRLSEGLIENPDELVRIIPVPMPAVFGNVDIAYFMYAVRLNPKSVFSYPLLDKIAAAFEANTGLHSYCCQLTKEYIIGIVIIPSRGIFPTDSYLSSCAKAVSDLMDKPCSIGIGGEYNDPAYGPQSLIEAVCSADNSDGQIDPSTVMFSMGDGNLDYENMIPMISDISALDELSDDQMQEAISAVQNVIMAKEISLGYARYLCFKTLYAIWLLKKIHSFESSGKGFPIIEIVQCESYDALCKMIGTYTEMYFTEKKESKEKNQSLLYDEMLKYLAAQVSSMDFSLQGMSDYFSMSLPILSKYFKDRNGKSIADYLNHLRLQKACEMLARTELTVKEIGESVGYNNVTSFIRRFRNEMGITPGQYRADSAQYRTD